MLEWNLLNVRSDKNEPVESSGLNCVDITEKYSWYDYRCLRYSYSLFDWFPKLIVRTLAEYTQASFYM